MEINLLLMTTILVSVTAVEKFCVHSRQVLLGGVFNYENIAFAYSWKRVVNESEPSQQQIVWRFQIINQRLVEMGNSLSVQQVFPGIPIFRAGFGLSLNCDESDDKCKLYDKLVFVFSLTFYNVFRFSDERFFVETDEERIPWSLQPKGDAKQFGFANTDFDNVYAAAFKPGVVPYIFIVSSQGILYKSAVDIRAPSLVWVKLSEDKAFGKVNGAFVSADSQLMFNQNDSLLIYDDFGVETKTTTVWSYFGCDDSPENSPEKSTEKSPEKQKPAVDENKNKQDKYGLTHEQQKTDNKYAAIIITVVIVAIIISNVTAVVFWTVVDKFKREDSSKTKKEQI